MRILLIEDVPPLTLCQPAAVQWSAQFLTPSAITLIWFAIWVEVYEMKFKGSAYSL